MHRTYTTDNLHWHAEVSEIDLTSPIEAMWNDFAGPVGFNGDVVAEGYGVLEMEWVDGHTLSDTYVHFELLNVENITLVDMETGEYSRQPTQEEIDWINDHIIEIYEQHIIDDWLDNPQFNH